MSGEAARELETDVVVVGAGPAGVVLSYLLARSGVETTLCERHGDLAREFRGYGFQPLVLRLFDQMGVLDDVLALPHAEIHRPEVVVYDRPYRLFDFSEFSARYDFTLLMEQPALLRMFVDLADEYETFTYRDRTPVSGLVREDGRVVGVRATDRDAGEDVVVRSRLVVGADGRYSTVRDAAGIDPGRLASKLELVWFKLPASAVPTAAQARVGDGDPILYFGLGGSEAQAGYFVEKGTYPALRERGIEAFRARLLRTDPSLAGALRDHLTDFEDCSLLRIEPGMSETWTRDGLLLVGDAAHIASPVGGQGNGLAIQDAAVAHRVVAEALADRDGVLPASSLRRVEAVRRPAVERVLAAQRRAERALTLLVLRDDAIPRAVRKPVLRAAFAALPRLPFARRTARLFAWGPERVDIETSHFADAPAGSTAPADDPDAERSE